MRMPWALFRVSLSLFSPVLLSFQFFKIFYLRNSTTGIRAMPPKTADSKMDSLEIVLDDVNSNLQLSMESMQADVNSLREENLMLQQQLKYFSKCIK